MIFSFVLPAYKGKYLEQAISSIIAQDYKEFELVVVDDCSLDDIRGIVSDCGVVNSQEHLVRFRWSSINISNDRRCGLEKFQARLLFSKWLQEHQVAVVEDEKWKTFYQRTVTEYLPIYNKLTMITTMSMLTWSHWIKSIKKLWVCDTFSLKDKCSIILRSFQKRIR